MESELIDALYVRVSTEMQKEEGESIENQKDRLIEYAKGKLANPVIYEDAGFSAKDLNRPALYKLLEEIKQKKIRSVTVTKLDRITRSIKDLIGLTELFEENNIIFKSITQPVDSSSAMGRAFIRLLGEFGQLEREMTSERVGEDMRHRARSGKWNGGVVPYGYTVMALMVRQLKKTGLTDEQANSVAANKIPEVKKLFINPEEAEVVKTIFAKYIELESIRGVTQWLNKSKFKTRQTKSWATGSISRILKNQTYIGKSCYNMRVTSKSNGKMKKRPKEEWIISDGLHEPLIDKDTFSTVQSILKRQTTTPVRRNSEYLVSGLCRCGVCGATLNGYTQQKITSRNPRQYSSYRCHAHTSKGSAVCKGTNIKKDVLENAVVETILSLSDSKKFKVEMKQALDVFNKEIGQVSKPLETELKKLATNNKSIAQRKTNLLECLEDGTIDKQTYKDRVVDLDSQFRDNQKRIYEIEVKLNDVGIENISFNGVYEIIKDFRLNWSNLDFLSKKNLLWSLISKIIVIDRQIKIELFFLPSLFSSFGNECVPVRLLWRREEGL